MWTWSASHHCVPLDGVHLILLSTVTFFHGWVYNFLRWYSQLGPWLALGCYIKLFQCVVSLSLADKIMREQPLSNIAGMHCFVAIPVGIASSSISTLSSAKCTCVIHTLIEFALRKLPSLLHTLLSMWTTRQRSIRWQYVNMSAVMDIQSYWRQCCRQVSKALHEQ